MTRSRRRPGVERIASARTRSYSSQSTRSTASAPFPQLSVDFRGDSRALCSLLCDGIVKCRSRCCSRRCYVPLGRPRASRSGWRPLGGTPLWRSRLGECTVARSTHPATVHCGREFLAASSIESFWSYVDRLTSINGLTDQQVCPSTERHPCGSFTEATTPLQAYQQAVELTQQRFGRDRSSLLTMALAIREYSPRVQVMRQAAAKVVRSSSIGYAGVTAVRSS